MALALITGASGGIGRELARIHAQNGGDAIIVARNLEKLTELAEELKSAYDISVYPLQKDLTRLESCDEIYAYALENSLDVDFVINNAGFGGQGMFHEREWEDDLSMIQVNVLALTRLTRLFLPGFVSRGSGRILNVSSTASLMPGPLQAVYFATKAFVTSFSHALSAELEKTGVTVTALLPGATETGFASRSGLEGSKLFSVSASAESVARAGYKAMLKGKMKVFAGVPLMFRLALPLLPLFPLKAVLNMVKGLQKVDT